MKLTHYIATFFFVGLIVLQLACKDDDQPASNASTTGNNAVSTTALVAMPSSAVVVAESNQVIAYNPDGNKGWGFSLPDNDTVAARPVTALSSTTYIRGTSGLYAIAPDGKVLWQTKHNGATDSLKGITPLSDSSVAITIGDNSLVGYNMQGQPKWTFKMPDGDKITGAPALAASSIVYLRSAKKIYAVDSQGNLAWQAEIGQNAKR